MDASSCKEGCRKADVRFSALIPMHARDPPQGTLRVSAHDRVRAPVAGCAPPPHPCQMMLLQSLGVTLPIIQAPMAGVSTPELAAAVSNAGGLGSIGVGATDASGARAMIEAVKRQTGRAFNVKPLRAHRAPCRRRKRGRVAKGPRTRVSPVRSHASGPARDDLQKLLQMTMTCCGCWSNSHHP